MITLRTTLALVSLLVLMRPPDAARAAVAADLRGGTLVLRGDAARDDLDIDDADGVADHVRVTPVNGTTLNGGTSALAFDAVTDLELALGEGDSDVSIRAAVLRRLTETAGRGDDRLSLDEGRIGSVAADLGDGANFLRLTDGMVILGDLTVMGGGGPDGVDLDDPSQVRGTTKAVLRGGDDFFGAFDSGAGPIVVRSGPGDDVVFINGAGVGALHADLGAGDDAFAIDRGGRIGGDLVVAGGQGDDLVNLAFSQIDGRALIALGAGDDRFAMSLETVGGDLAVRTGRGDDTFDLFESSVGGDARFDAGHGSSTVTIDGGFKFDGALTFHGRDGADRIDVRGGLSVTGDAHFTLRGGDDAIAIQEARFAHDLVVDTGPDDDTVSLSHDTVTVAGKTVIDTGTGTDVVGP